MVECLRVFDNEKHRGELLLPHVDHHWIVQNYVKLLDTFFSGYWNDFIKQNIHKGEDGLPNQSLLKVGQAYGVRAKDVVPEDVESFEPMEILA